MLSSLSIASLSVWVCLRRRRNRRELRFFPGLVLPLLQTQRLLPILNHLALRRAVLLLLPICVDLCLDARAFGIPELSAFRTFSTQAL